MIGEFWKWLRGKDLPVREGILTFDISPILTAERERWAERKRTGLVEVERWDGIMYPVTARDMRRIWRSIDFGEYSAHNDCDDFGFGYIFGAKQWYKERLPQNPKRYPVSIAVGMIVVEPPQIPDIVCFGVSPDKQVYYLEPIAGKMLGSKRDMRQIWDNYRSVTLAC